jgi:hypothetical protein
VDTSKLAPETLRVWEFLSAQPALAGFILIGGTALTMHIGHRISEDLDFMTTDPKLPRASLTALVKILERNGFTVARDDDPTLYDEFLNDGLDLHDYHQLFLVDGVKVDFFSPDPDFVGMVEASRSPLPRVASLAELFRTKALAAATRSQSRDWIDLYVLFRQHGFGLVEFHEAFQRPAVHDPAQKIGRAFQNLCRGATSPTDPGYESLMQSAPSLSELAAFFKTMREEYEVQQAREAFRAGPQDKS